MTISLVALKLKLKFLALGAFLAYFAASSFFWHHPHLIHKKKNKNFRAMHISHRGGCAEGYENTIKNFRKCIQNGSNMLELDVRMTKDGQVVVVHDQDLKRIAGWTQQISELNFDQLPPYKETVPIDNIPGSHYHDPTWSEDDRRVPLLEQVFAEFPSIPMNIDIKDHDKELVEKVAALVKQYDRAELTVWGSFNNETCDWLYEADPKVGLFFSMKKTLLLILLSIVGLLPFFSFNERYYEVFLPSAIRKRFTLQNGSLTFKEKLIYYICKAFLISKSLVKHLQKRGIQVYVWVLNDEEDFLEAVELGVDGIMTDYPVKLTHFLSQEQCYKQ